MKVNDITNYLNSKYPAILASDFDKGKIGLQFGSNDADVKKVLIALDGSSDVINEAINKNIDLVILHHPFMFNPLLSLNYNSEFGKKIQNVINSNLNIYAMHTNFDVAKDGMNDILASILELKNIKSSSSEITQNSLIRIGEVEAIKLSDFIDFVKFKFEEKMVRYVGNDNKIIKKVGIVGGAGASEIFDAIKNECDVFISGEFHHHNAYDAIDHNIALIEVSHSVERLFANTVRNILLEQFKDLEVFISDNNINPYKVK